MSKWVMGGKGGGSQYDPQIGQAASQSAATAARAQSFAENYYNNVLTPLIKQQGQVSVESQGKLNNLYDLNATQMQNQINAYNKYGIPAEQKYYNMVDQYSEPAEYERQATLAQGNFGQAQANQAGALGRQFSAAGIDPTSPAAMAARSNMAVMNAAAQAGAMNRARNTARQMGMQLTSDAANYGRGGLSNVNAFGNSASGNATGAFGIANGALGTASTAGNGVMAGYQTALSGYNNIMDNYTKLGQSDIQAQAASGGLGSLLGGAAGIAFSDMRLKENMLRVGELPSGIGIWRYNFIGKDETETGVLAQEVRSIIPEAVLVADNGYLMVDYSKLR